MVRRRALLAAVLLCPALGVLPGCPPKVGYRKGGLISRMVFAKRERQVEIDGVPITNGRFTAFDIDNPDGSVTIRVADGYPEAYMGARVRHEGKHKDAAREEGWEFDTVKHWFHAEHVTAGETGVVTVRPTEATLADGTRPFLDLWVETPVCDGLEVRSRYGSVRVIGLRGSVRVESDGDIEIKTEEPLSGTIELRSREGDVVLIAPPESKGTFLITAPDGRVVFNARNGRTEQARPREGEWSGVYNRGTNPITIISEQGDAEVYVREHPEHFTAPW